VNAAKAGTLTSLKYGFRLKASATEFIALMCIYSPGMIIILLKHAWMMVPVAWVTAEYRRAKETVMCVMDVEYRF